MLAKVRYLLHRPDYRATRRIGAVRVRDDRSEVATFDKADALADLGMTRARRREGLGHEPALDERDPILVKSVADQRGGHDHARARSMVIGTQGASNRSRR